MRWSRKMRVSISQSRYFSFQVLRSQVSTRIAHARFNLAIEILLFSGFGESLKVLLGFSFRVSISQSRYFSFQGDRGVRLRSAKSTVSISQSRYFSFQAAFTIELARHWIHQVSISQSRYFSFQGSFTILLRGSCLMFQSRNRDTSLFRSIDCAEKPFNTMFQSRNRDTSLFRLNTLDLAQTDDLVSISQSRYFSFQVWVFTHRPTYCAVSISQSRYFSFQVCETDMEQATKTYVSISQSRYFSFQAAVTRS